MSLHDAHGIYERYIREKDFQVSEVRGQSVYGIFGHVNCYFCCFYRQHGHKRDLERNRPSKNMKEKSLIFYNYRL